MKCEARQMSRAQVVTRRPPTMTKKRKMHTEAQYAQSFEMPIWQKDELHRER